jgi:electron transport complex protein RnfG
MKKTKLGVILMLYASIACASLAVVYAFTKDSIERQSEIQLQSSLKDIFPQATTFELVEDLTSPEPNIKFETVYEVKSDNVPLGLAIKVSGPSYGGNATLLVGIDLHRSIAGVRIMALNDTPGLGMNASNPTYYVDKAKKVTFLGQFEGKFLTDPFEVKKDVAAITAATITSKSLTKIVKTAGDAAIAYMDQKVMMASMEGEKPAGETSIGASPAVSTGSPTGSPIGASTGTAKESAKPQAGGK